MAAKAKVEASKVKAYVMKQVAILKTKTCEDFLSVDVSPTQFSLSDSFVPKDLQMVQTSVLSYIAKFLAQTGATKNYPYN